MIMLYELQWSHYCEKVRLALDYMGLEWRRVGIDAFSKSHISAHARPAHLPSHTVPAIHDARTDAFVMDSTPILRYLAATYPDAPALFPGDERNREAVDRKLIELDTSLGLPARRFAYTQAILECPVILTALFFGRRGGVVAWPGVRSAVGACIGMMLCKRFEFHRSEALGLYEALESYLLSLSVELDGREFVVGERFSAADLALAAQLRPLGIVPFFAEHPGLAGLFERQRRTLQRWSREGEFAYETAIRQARTRKPPVRRRLRERSAALPFESDGHLAGNDQRPIWTWGMFAMPYHYLVTLRRGKRRQRAASAAVR